jgi:outer membrane protein assembly factor BamE (lipoprotein component of BamABCDE complex)
MVWNFNFCFVVSLFLMLVGCTSHIDHRGKLPEPAEVGKIKANQHTKEDVLRMLGSPSSTSIFDENTWLYYYKVTERLSFFEPKSLEQKLIIIRFDAMDKVKEVLITAQPEEEIAPSKDITPSVGHERPLLHQIFGNFGRAAHKEGNKTGK